MIIKHIPGVYVKARFSVHHDFRYTLSIKNRDRKTGKTVCAIMQNPSVADEQRADKSVRFLEELVFNKDYSEFRNVTELVVVNLFAFIQTNDFEGRDDQIGTKNDFYIRKSIAEADIILVAWGKNNDCPERKETIRRIIDTQKNKPHYQTLKHPSRGRYKNFLVPYTPSLSFRTDRRKSHIKES